MSSENKDIEAIGALANATTMVDEIANALADGRKAEWVMYAAIEGNGEHLVCFAGCVFGLGASEIMKQHFSDYRKKLAEQENGK